MIKGTNTEKNLLKAFAGESQARNRYTMYASVARQEGFEQIAAIFLETADNEREHASLFYKKLEGGSLEIIATYPAGNIGSTLQNLEFAFNGEHDEAASIYPGFAKTAREEGFEDIALLFENISTIELQHEKRYMKLYDNIKNKIVFERNEDVEWECRECGYVHKGTSAPEACPVCSHPKAFYQLKIETY